MRRIYQTKAYEPENLKRTDNGSYPKNPKGNQSDQANSAAAAMQSMQKKVITRLTIIIIKKKNKHKLNSKTYLNELLQTIIINENILTQNSKSC